MPDSEEVVFRTWYSSSEVIDTVVLVTEIAEVKHHYEEGIQPWDWFER